MSWTAPEIARDPVPFQALAADERTTLDGWLEHHRRTLLGKCGGLTAEQLKRRSVEPSGLSLLGLVRHMAEVERDWFRYRFGGERPGYLYCTDEDLDAEFDVADADAAADLATYAGEVELVRKVTAGRSLDETFLDPRRGVEMTLRWVYTVMIQEYARHNGHADLLRERIDGATGH